MKKIFTLIAAAFIAVAASAQSAEPTLVLQATPVSGYEATTGVPCLFEEYADSVVIRAFDGKKGNDLVCTWDEKDWCAINGEANPWIYFHNEGATYYSAYLYAMSGYMSGSWNATDGGNFWICGYFYTSYEDTNPAWTYMYWNLTPIASSIESTEAAAATPAVIKTADGIIRGGVKYNYQGQRVK